jgi:hypothetical protein
LPADISDGVHHQIVDTIIEPLFRQISRSSRSMPRRPPAKGYGNPGPLAKSKRH